METTKEDGKRNNIIFYTHKEYSWAKVFEDNYEAILADYLLIEEEAKDHHCERYNEQWGIYGMWSPNLDKIETPATFTQELVHEYVPNHGAAGFSVIDGPHHIEPHTGIVGDTMRMHLGVIIPEGNLGMRTIEDDVTIRWEEGKTFLFLDYPEHEAWNLTDKRRVILIIDSVL